MSPRESASEKIWPRWKVILPGAVSGTLAIAVGLFIAAAVALAVNFSRQSESFGWVEHTNDLLHNISALEKGVLEAESGARGYLLTGARSYFDSYNRAQADIPKLLAAARQVGDLDETSTDTCAFDGSRSRRQRSELCRRRAPASTRALDGTAGP